MEITDAPVSSIQARQHTGRYVPRIVDVNFMVYFFNVIMYTVKIHLYNRPAFAIKDDLGMSKHV